MRLLKTHQLSQEVRTEELPDDVDWREPRAETHRHARTHTPPLPRVLEYSVWKDVNTQTDIRDDERRGRGKRSRWRRWRLFSCFAFAIPPHILPAIVTESERPWAAHRRWSAAPHREFRIYTDSTSCCCVFTSPVFPTVYMLVWVRRSKDTKCVSKLLPEAKLLWKKSGRVDHIAEGDYFRVLQLWFSVWCANIQRKITWRK